MRQVRHTPINPYKIPSGRVDVKHTLRMTISIIINNAAPKTALVLVLDGAGENHSAGMSGTTLAISPDIQA